MGVRGLIWSDKHLFQALGGLKEVEEVVYGSGLVAGAAALGLPHATLGQAIALVASHHEGAADVGQLREQLLAHCRKELPNFMVPLAVIVRDSLPHNQNGKIDRRALADEYRTIFQDTSLQDDSA